MTQLRDIFAAMDEHDTDGDAEPSNDQRAEWAREAVDVFGETVFCGRTFTDEAIEGPDGDTGDAHDMVMDLIGNLCHLAHRHKWDVDLMVAAAVATFKEERDEEAAENDAANFVTDAAGVIA